MVGLILGKKIIPPSLAAPISFLILSLILGYILLILSIAAGNLVSGSVNVRVRAAVVPWGDCRRFERGRERWREGGLSRELFWPTFFPPLLVLSPLLALSPFRLCSAGGAVAKLRSRLACSTSVNCCSVSTSVTRWRAFSWSFCLAARWFSERDADVFRRGES